MVDQKQGVVGKDEKAGKPIADVKANAGYCYGERYRSEGGTGYSYEDGTGD